MKKQDVASKLRQRSQEVAELLKVLGHPQRLMILCSLADGEKTVGELEDFTGASQSAVSQFVKAMRLEGLLESTREGQYVYYRISDQRVLKLMKALYEIYCS